MREAAARADRQAQRHAAGTHVTTQRHAVGTDARAGAPAPAWEVGEDRRPGRENVYGHRKRLEFIAACLRGQQTRIDDAKRARGESPGPLRVLDLGCGTGVMITRPLARLGFDVTGLDMDAVSVRQAARLNAEPALPNLTYLTGRLEDQRWPGVFDAVVCSEVLEHIPDPDGVLVLLKNCLKDDGILVLTVPNGYGLFEMDSHLHAFLSRVPGFWRLESAWNRVRTALLSLSGGQAEAQAAAAAEDRPESLATLNDNSPHCQRFTRGKVARLLEKHGLRLVASGRSAIWSGPIAHTLMRDFAGLVRLNCALADRLPAWMASGHYFCFRKPSASS